MPIHAPGRRDRRNRALSGKDRSVVAMLSLTAMVDMFTVLAVFLLQNYKTDANLIDVSDKVELPKAHAVKELKPAHVIVVSKQAIMVDKDMVLTFEAAKAQTEWKLDALLQRLQADFKKVDDARKSMPLQAIKREDPVAERNQADDDHRVTIQADKSIDFLIVKKVMFTVVESGASQVSFAVIKDEVAKTP